MPDNRVKVIGIAGPSGSGKSTLCHALVRWLSDNPFAQDFEAHGAASSSNNHQPCIVADAFPEDPQYFLNRAAPPSYKDRDPISETPESMDWDAYVGDLTKRIRELEAKYCKDIAGSTLSTSVVLVVEHFLLLQDPRIRNLLDLLIYLDPTQTPDAKQTLRERRVQRSPRTDDESNCLRSYYDNHVWPSFLQYTHAMVETTWSIDTKTTPKNGPCPLLAVDCIGMTPKDIQQQVQQQLLQEWGRLN